MFLPNPSLPPDAVELSSNEPVDRSDYFKTPPKKLPLNVPPDFIPVRVFQGKDFIGWTYMAKEQVVALHQGE